MNDFTLEQLKPGLKEHFSITLSEKMFDDFALLSGDHNPLHVDAAYAQAQGFKGRVCYGMLLASFYSTLAGMYLPGKKCVLHAVDSSFHKPAYAGDRLTIEGEVTHVSASVRQIEIQARIINQDGQAISKATIKAGLHD